ncbi:oxysterol-binding protein [Stipitochalara longipes BDJ]|nr:oxysterol-binding protein [Stipitochalara longipes BDJ]
MAKTSKFSDFIKFLGSVKGDLANITAPPYFLAPLSVVEGGSAWTERPSIFAAAAAESSADLRALLILKWIIIAAKPQFYVGGPPGTSIKKPLNAFLGEIFLGTWTDGHATSHLVAEQVSHHPPISAVYMWDDENGISATGYTRISMTFSGTLNVKQTGHGIVHIDRYDEDYLTPALNGCVKGFLSGHLYPEITGTYHIVSSTGFISEITFSGQGLFWGKKNSFDAKLYRRDDPSKTALYHMWGQWSDKFTIKDMRTDNILEVVDTNAPENDAATLSISKVDEQDPWESRRAWKHVIEALRSGNYGDAVTEKTKIENAQREMRSAETKSGRIWKPLFFYSLEGGSEHDTFHKLGAATGWKLWNQWTNGIWKADTDKLKRLKKPFRDNITPLG